MLTFCVPRVRKATKGTVAYIRSQEQLAIKNIKYKLPTCGRKCKWKCHRASNANECYKSESRTSDMVITLVNYTLTHGRAKIVYPVSTIPRRKSLQDLYFLPRNDLRFLRRRTKTATRIPRVNKEIEFLPIPSKWKNTWRRGNRRINLMGFEKERTFEKYY